MDPITVTAEAIKNITALLAQKGWTQKELGDRSGFAAPDVSRLMRPNRATSLVTLTKVADALGVPLWELLRPADAPPLKLSKVQRAEPGTGRKIPDLGKVAAGVAIDPKGDHDLVEVWGLPDSGEFVIFTVAGDSMEDALIGSGDRVIIRLQPDAESGEDVVCQIDGCLTLKTFHIGKGDKKGYWLLPHNDQHKPIRVDAAHDPRIVGVLYEVRRKAKNGRRPNGRPKK